MRSTQRVIAMRRAFSRVKHRVLIGAAQALANRGYRAPIADPIATYSDLRVAVMSVLDDHPGMRCYEVEEHLGLDTTKQRVTNSILRDLEEDGMVFTVSKRWDPVRQQMKTIPRQYYLDF